MRLLLLLLAALSSSACGTAEAAKGIRSGGEGMRSAGEGIGELAYALADFVYWLPDLLLALGLTEAVRRGKRWKRLALGDPKDKEEAKDFEREKAEYWSNAPGD